MVRIKTVIHGQVFLSPFVYTESAGKWLINKLNKWHNTSDYKLEHIMLENSPVNCLYNQTWELDDVMEKLIIAERTWAHGNYERVSDTSILKPNADNI